MAARQPVLNFLPTLLSLLSFILILLLLLAGTNNVLSSLYYLQADTTSLSIPSKLSTSTFLADLSSVSGADFTGSAATASSLGLADSYSVLLLTSCAHFHSGATVCDRPRLGFWFDPATRLRLDSTSLQQGTFPPALASALAAYRGASGFLAAAYLASAVLVALAPVAGSLSSGANHRVAAVVAAVASALATALLFGAGVAAVVVFRGLDAQINAAFADAGLKTTAGVVPVALGFVAFALALATAVIYGVRARTGRRGTAARSIGSAYGAPDAPDGKTAGQDGKPGLWKRIPTWSKHRYVQVERQPALLKTKLAPSMEAVVVTSPSGTTRLPAEGDDWAGEDEYTAGAAGQAAIPMLSLGGNKREKDVNTAYEPYSGARHGSV